jgi:starch phosphorylase
VHDHFEPIYDSLLMQNDQYFVLRDFAAYVEAQDRVEKAYQQRDKWLEMSVINIAHSGHFSSDRTIREYANHIWNIQPISWG